MAEKRNKSKKRMQTQAKPSNRANERSIPRAIDNIYEKESTNFKK